MTNLGVHGVQKCNPSFQSLDMKFHYSSELLLQTFDQIGETGRTIYQNYLFLDSIFTICFLIVMLTITNSLFTKGVLQNIVFIICILKALFEKQPFTSYIK